MRWDAGVKLTRDELDALGRPPRAEVLDAVERADGMLGMGSDGAAAGVEAAATLVDAWERQFAGFVDGFGGFVAAIQEWLLAEHGLDGLAAAQRVDGWLAHASTRAFTAGDVAELGRRHGAEVAAVLRAGGPDAVEHAMAVWGDVESAWRKAHDLYRDLVATWLSHVYRAHGVDGLEACLRHSAERTLLGWMPVDLSRPSEVRVRQWSRMLRGNFARIHVDEDDEGFTITSDPCGTCTRQIRDGALDPPLALAVVDEVCPLTFGHGGVPVYRTHVAVFHQLLPQERVGAEWPEVRCPAGAGTGPCTTRLLHEATTDATIPPPG
jgi:hypothetical protein